MQNKFIYWWQKCLRFIVVRLAILPNKVAAMVAVVTISMLGMQVGATPMSYAITISQASVAVNPSKYIQHKQTTLEAKVPNINVYRSPDCSCCGGWIAHLKTQGFSIQDFPTPDIDAVKQRYKVPDNLTSCHTAIVNGYVIEGHVPANDIKRLLQERPNVSGLSVPQMPVGTPGMEIGNKFDPFTVYSFAPKNKIMVFNDYPLRTN
nr:DUF411 domain-containing protein [Hassalia byssoidea]